MYNKLISAFNSLVRPFYDHWRSWLGSVAGQKMGLKKWHLDSPSCEHGIQLRDDGVLVFGWLAARRSVKSLQVIIRHSSFYDRVIECDVSRPDVTQTLYERLGMRLSNQCGFKTLLPFSIPSADLYAVIDGQEAFLCRLDIKQIAEATATEITPKTATGLEGKSGWLFLANDSNSSRDQAAGIVRLTDLAYQDWERYFQDLHSLILSSNSKYCFLVAPAKELVYKEFYPEPVSEHWPTDDLIARLSHDIPLVYPVAPLRDMADPSYSKTDSHWTHQGAKEAFICACEQLGIARAELQTLFAKDIYKVKPSMGDIGNKFEPARYDDVAVVSHSWHLLVQFDNRMPNFGRVMIMENPNALLPGCCVIFGASSTYNMMSFITRTFQRVVFSHSAARLDAEILEFEKPDYMISQTSARFMIRPPEPNYSSREAMLEKWARPDTDQQDILNRIIVPDDLSTVPEFYLSLLPPCHPASKCA